MTVTGRHRPRGPGAVPDAGERQARVGDQGALGFTSLRCTVQRVTLGKHWALWF